jgi:nucleoside-diphosphate-sugar epimerase
MRKKIVITGAAGAVIGRVLPKLREEYDLTLLDIHDTDSTGQTIEGVHKVDMVNPDRDTYRRYFKGADSVIHAAYRFSIRTNKEGTSLPASGQYDDSQFKFALEDTQMSYNIYKTAQEEGVKRAIMFSSNHASDYYEQLIQKNVLESVTEDMPPYSDNFYGWSKICGETLGHIFAAGMEGRGIEVIMIRAGAPRTDLIENTTSDDYYRIRRNFASYMSVEDEMRMLRLCIEKEDIRDENGVPFLLFYATSNNYNRIWSLRNAVNGLGYDPKDSSYHDYSERIKQLFTGAIDKETLPGKGRDAL